MMTPKIEDFGLSPLRITTYYNEEILQLNLSDTSLKWHIHSSPFYGKCYTLTLSSEITRLGIKQITIEANHKKQFGVFFHTFGSASDSWDIRMPGFLAKSSSRQAVEITHEFIQLLDYDGEKSNNERALAMIGSVGLFWIIGTFHITNFDSEGINIGNFLSRTILILWIKNFL